MRPKLLVRLDANTIMGMGHAVRVKALLDELGPFINPVICGEGNELTKVFPDLPLYAIDQLPFLSYDLFLQDCACPQQLEQVDQPIILIDDMGGDFKADLIINGTILPEYHVYQGMKPDAEVLCGGQFALLRKEFSHPYPPSPKITDVVIIAGSGLKASVWVENLLYEMKPLMERYHFTLIVGQQFTFPSKLGDFAGKIDFYQGLSTKELITKLRQSKLALITGGMILYECLALGIPTLSYASVDAIRPEIEWFEKQGATYNIEKITNLKRAVEHYVNDPYFLQKHAQKGKEIIDGQGVKRVATKIREKFML